MAVAARKLEEYEYFDMPATRVYSHAPTKAQAQSEARRRNEERRQVLEAKRRAARKETLRKGLMLMNIGIAAGAVLLVLARYSIITLEYQKVNTLRDEISQIQLELKALNVQFNSAVSLDRAKEAAAAAGMRYPTAGQILTVQGGTENGAEDYDIEFEEG